MTDTEEVQVEVVVDLAKCCRLCLVADEKQNYENIFKHSLLMDNSVSIVEALQKVTGMDVSGDVRLPEQICDGCCRKLEDSFHFINEVVSNHEILIELVNLETIKEAQTTGCALELGHNSESEPSETPPDAPGMRRKKRPQMEPMPGSVDGEPSQGTCSDRDEPDAAPGTPDELDAVNLILNKFTTVKRETTKPRAPYTGKRKIHKCPQCGKTFQRKSNLIDHQRLHSKIKLYQCEYCDKSFVQSGNLTQHLRTHTAEKPYSCTVCSKPFSQSSALKTHMNIHLQRRPFECSHCTKAFPSSSDLHRHLRTHDRQKRFCCPMCSDRVFTQKVHLRMHLTRIHPRCNVEEMVALGTKDNDTDNGDKSMS